MRSCQFLIFCALLPLINVTNAQTPAPADVRVKLVFADKKDVFRVGEQIRLNLEFSADREGYRVETGPDGGTVGNDVVVVAPETGITHWLDELQDNRPVPRHAYGIGALGSRTEAVEIILNDTLRFDSPGRYTVSVTTRRVSTNSSSRGFPLTTNALSFEIQPMSEADEEKEVKRLSELLNTRRDSVSVAELTRQLSFLSGDPSTREKLRRFLSPEPADYGAYMYTGLFIARNRLLVLKSLEAALRDPNIPATTSMVAATTRLKTMLTHGIREKPADGITWFLEAPENPLAAEIREGYIVELAAGLAKRTGSNQTTTAVTILTFLQKDGRTTSNPGLPEVRRILVQQFDTLHFSTKDWLLREHAKLLDDPALIPSLKKILSASDSTSKSTRGTVLGRLMELAPDEARPYVIAEIRDVNSPVDPAILIGLQDESLPELDATLLDQIRSLTSLSQNKDFKYLKFKIHLLVRFATNNIYGDVMELYRRVGKGLPVDSRAGLLAYFAKHNDEEAIPLIEQALSDVKSGQASILLTQLTALYYSKSIGALLKKLLETDDISQASNAAYLIGVHGLPGDEQLLEARLKRWREQWSDRVAEADAQRHGLIERSLVTALITGKSWKLSDTRANELRMSCLTQLCKESNPTH
ncbi:MAG TPA: hypothetical protein VGW58_07610 [Pyrinomonadaceae bacterium]|nr:hypothetical protein [Pyrinomonadaceae bacterium]